ncbi:MAG: hypothetical protein P1S59_14675, partial [bacterium]|nr:hypothetical protein [bacterium]
MAVHALVVVVARPGLRGAGGRPGVADDVDHRGAAAHPVAGVAQAVGVGRVGAQAVRVGAALGRRMLRPGGVAVVAAAAGGGVARAGGAGTRERPRLPVAGAGVLGLVDGVGGGVRG